MVPLLLSHDGGRTPNPVAMAANVQRSVRRLARLQRLEDRGLCSHQERQTLL
jgi:hypothetical protein